MAYLDDDFQSYSIGATVPFGSWILDTGAFTKQIVSGFAPTGMDRSLQLTGTIAIDPGLGIGYLNSFSEFFAVRKTSGGDLVAFANGPNAFGQIFELLRIRVENDGTVSAYITSTLLENSIDALFEFYAINFFHVWVVFTDSLVLGVNHVKIQCQVILNGTKVLDFNIVTGTAVTQLKNVTSEVNRFQVTTNGANYSAFTLDVLQAITYYPHPGSPSAIAFQAVAEVDVLPNTAKIKAFQAVAEVNVLPSNAEIRIFQAVAEVDIRARPQAPHRGEYIHSRHLPGD